MQPSAHEMVTPKRSSMSTEADGLPAQIMENYVDSLFFLVKRAFGLRLLAAKVGSGDFASTETAVATFVPKLDPTFQSRLVALLRKAVEDSPRKTLGQTKLDEALAGAIDDAAAERDASESSWANAVRTFEVALTATTLEAAAFAASTESTSLYKTVSENLQSSFEAAWASAPSDNKLVEVLRFHLGVGPHDLFPPDAMRRFRPGDHVCIAPESKEHSSWRSGTVIDMTVVATDEPRYAISLKADSMDPLGGTATAKGEIQCSSRVLKHAVEWDADEALFDKLAIRLLDALPLKAGDDDDGDGLELASASDVFLCLMAAPLHIPSDSSNSMAGSNSAEGLDVGELCARVRAAFLRSGASDRDCALQHALFGGTLRASHQLLQRAWEHVVSRCGEPLSPGESGQSNDSGTAVKGRRGSTERLPVEYLARLLGSRRFARQSLELPIALPPSVASAIACTIACPPAAGAAGLQNGNCGDVKHGTVRTVKKPHEEEVSAEQFKAWCAPPRPVASLVNVLLGMAQSQFGGDLDAMYDALDYDGDQQLDKAELVSRLAKLGSSSGGPSPNHRHNFVLSDPELDALIAAADLGNGQSTWVGSGGGYGRGDGMVSRREWRRLVQGQGSAHDDEDVSLKGTRRDGSNESGGDNLTPFNYNDNEDVERSSHVLASRNLVIKSVTSSMFRAFALRDLRSDLSPEELELCFARVCVFKDDGNNSGHEMSDNNGSGMDATGSNSSSSKHVVSPATMKGSLLTLGEIGSAAVDRAMEIDFGRFNHFLKLLRAKVLDKMRPSIGIDASNQGVTVAAPNSKAGGHKVALHKQGAIAWALRLKSLFEEVDSDRSGCIDASEFRHFVLALWFGDATAAAKDLVEPAWRLIRFPEEVATTEMAAMHAASAEACHLRALDRYLARLVDGLDWSGNCRLELEELHAFLTFANAPDNADSAEPPVVVCAVRYAMNRLVQPKVRRANVLTARGGGGARAAFQALKTAVTPTAFSPSKRANSSSSSSAGIIFRNSHSDSSIINNNSAESSDHNSYLETLAVKAALTHRAIKGRAPLLEKLYLGACHNTGRNHKGTEHEGGIDEHSDRSIMDLPRSKWGKPSGIVAPLLAWQADAVLARLDGNGEGLISYSEFERFALPPRGREGVRSAVARLLDVEVDPPGSVAALVRALDPDGNGAVGRLELSSGLALLGLPLGGTEADELFDALNGWLFLRAPPTAAPRPLPVSASSPGESGVPHPVSLELLDCGFLDKGGAVLVDLVILLRRLHGHTLTTAAAEEAAVKAVDTSVSTQSAVNEATAIADGESNTLSAEVPLNPTSKQTASVTVAAVEMLLNEAQDAQWPSNGQLNCGQYTISREASLRRVRNLLIEFHPACQPASNCTGWRSLPCEGNIGSTTSGDAATNGTFSAPSPAHAWALAALGKDGAEWADLVAKARLGIGRKAPVQTLREALRQRTAAPESTLATATGVESESENDHTAPSVDSLTVLVALQEAAAMAIQVIDVVGPFTFLVLAVATAQLNKNTQDQTEASAAANTAAMKSTVDKPGAASNALAQAAARAWSEEWPDLWASLWRAALLTLLEGCQRVAGTSVARLLAQTNYGQLVCLSAGKGADIRAMSAQAALLIGLVRRPVPSSTGGTSDGGTSADSPAAASAGNAEGHYNEEDAEAIDSAALVDACKLVRINFGSRMLSADTLLPRGVAFLQGDPLPRIESLHLCPDFYAGTIASVSMTMQSSSSRRLPTDVHGPPSRQTLSLSLFASCGAAAPAASLMGSLGYAALPSNDQPLEPSLLHGGGKKSNLTNGGGSNSGGVPRLACFQAEQGRLFPECIPARCAGEQSALQLAEASLAKSHHRTIGSSTAADRGSTHSWHLHSRPSGLTALQERRLHQRGLDPLGLADVLASFHDDNDDDDNCQSETSEVKVAVELGGNLKPSWARSVESELLESFQSTASKKKSTKPVDALKTTKAATTAKAVTAKRHSRTTSSQLAVPRQTATKDNQIRQRKQPKPRVVSWGDNDDTEVKADAPHSMTRDSAGNLSSSLAALHPPSSSLTHSLPLPPSSEKDIATSGYNAAGSAGDSAVTKPASPPPPPALDDLSSELPLRRHIRLLASGGATADVEFWSAAEHPLDDVECGEDSGDEVIESGGGAAAGKRTRDELPYRITIEPSRDGLAGVAWQALAYHRLMRWLEGGVNSTSTRSSSSSSSVVGHAPSDVLAPLPLHLCVGPRGLAALVQAQQRAQGRLRLRTVLLGNRASRAHCVAEAWQLRCSALEASVAEITEESARMQRRLERQLRVAQRQHDAEREAASQKWHRAQAESAQRLASAKEALRAAEGTVGDAVLQERRRVTQYWRSRVADTYGERETRVRSLLAFAAAEIDALAGELGSRGPAQLDEERHRLRALSRRVHAEAANESDPMPIAFPRTAQPLNNNNTAGRGAAAPPRSRKLSSSSSGIRAPPSGQLPSKSSSRAAQGAVMAGGLGQMEDGVTQMKELLMQIKNEQDMGVQESGAVT